MDVQIHILPYNNYQHRYLLYLDPEEHIMMTGHANAAMTNRYICTSLACLIILALIIMAIIIIKAGLLFDPLEYEFSIMAFSTDWIYKNSI